jgi:hypothetical protein
LPTSPYLCSLKLKTINKKWILVLIIAFPSFFWLILETSTINSKKLPHYGPKKIIVKGDTAFYTVPDQFYNVKGDSLKSLESYPVFAVAFLNHRYRDESYRISGLWEYLKYTSNKLEHIPFVLVCERMDTVTQAFNDLNQMRSHSNIHFYSWNKAGFDSITRLYFREKPYYIDYSFFVLVDGKRNIRGYYDGRYVPEIKRLIEEYQHLRLKEEKEKLIQSNEIDTRP